MSRLMTVEEVVPGEFCDSFEDVDNAGRSKRFAELPRRFDGVERPVPELGSGYTQMCVKIDPGTDWITVKK